MSEEKKPKLTKDQLALLHEVAMHGMRDEDIAALLEISPKDLINFFFKQVYLGRIEGKRHVQKAAFVMSTCGEFPSMTMFWLKVQDKWEDNHSNAIKSQKSKDMEDVEEYDFSLLDSEELATLEELYAKARKKPANINSGSQSPQVSKGIH